MKTAPIRTTTAIRAEIGSVRLDLKTLYFRVKGGRDHVASLRRDAIISACCDHPGDVGSAIDGRAYFAILHTRNDHGTLAAQEAVLTALENSPEFAEASMILDPLVAELTSATLAEEEARQAIAEAEQALAAISAKVEAEAFDAARASLAKNPLVAEAKTKLKSALAFVGIGS